ncbi:lanthionine synthetase LanC family protein [Streptomyces roseoverticillatus]|uniref:class III lanthionine synthetase LanKC N-terminal domain-containing protein n=1 Tax=Streptomyces roseoverticillatus TaxID=66429 RepID=UPI003F568510
MRTTTGEQCHADYARALEALAERLPPAWHAYVRQDGPVRWHVFDSGSTLPDQGWKLHVSASAAEATDLVETVLTELVGAGVTFKLPADVQALVHINAGLAGRPQVGKIVTAYPSSDEVLAALVERLDAVWRPDRAPRVVSNLPVGSGGALSIRYGAFTGKQVVTDSVGVPRTALRAPDGTLHPDVRSLDGRQPPWTTPPVPPADRARAVPPGAPLEIDGARYLPLKVLAANVRGHVALGLRLSDRRLVVIRHRLRGVEGDEYGNDAVSRLENERQALLRLAGSGVCHELVGHDPVGGYLVVSDGGGTRLEDLPVEHRLERLPELAAAVARMHAHRLVHRDLKLANLRIGPDGLRLVDLELAAPAGAEHPVPAGTQGYVPPEGLYAAAAPSYDVYALGSCITHAVLGYCPSHLPEPGRAGRQIGLLRRHGMKTAASLVKACHHAAPARRPTAAQVAERLHAALPALTAEAATAPAGDRVTADPRTCALDRRWARAAAISAGVATRRFAVNGAGSLYWRNTHLAAAHACEGINIGAAGIIIGLATLDTALGTEQFTDDIGGAARWLAARPAFADAHGFFTGNSGVAVALALAGRRLERADLIESARRRYARAADSEVPNYDLFSGAAGIVWAGCLLDTVLGDSWGRDLAERQAARVRTAARTADEVIGWPTDPATDPSGRIYTGAAHGAAGVAMALGVWGRATGCTASSGLAEEAMYRLAEHAVTDDGTGRAALRWTTSGGTRPTHHWCHGLAGYLWCHLQLSAGAGAGGEEPARLDRTVEAFENAMPALDNPTMCHGLAGELENWRMLRTLPRHHDRATEWIRHLTDDLRLLHLTRDGDTMWPSEDPSVVTPDLWVGFLGPAAQLALAASGSADAMLSPAWLRRCSVPPEGTRSTSDVPAFGPGRKEGKRGSRKITPSAGTGEA